MDSARSGVLAQLLAELASGRLKIIDLTTPLGPDTTVIDLPPMFAPSPGVTLTEISRYDSRGPAWYWNILNMGEHTGTHFDAPIHWITGKDLPNNATDTIPPTKFIGPACVIDVTIEVQEYPDFLLTTEYVEAWEGKHGRIPAGAWVLLRQVGASSAHYAAATRWLVESAPGDRFVQKWQVQLIHGHGGRVGQPITLEVCRDTNHVRALETVADRSGETAATARASA